jgi:ABC-type nitrate/sulfonate/bicarbonate transport system substrate-binding protein
VGNATEIAISKGWLREEYGKCGTRFTWIRDLPESEWIKHYTQEPPLSFRDGGNIPPIWAKSRGIETNVIGLKFLSQSQAVLVRPDSAIRNLDDLRAKKLAVSRHINARVDFWWATEKRAWNTILRYANLTEKNVQMIELTSEKKFHHQRAESDAAFFSADKNSLEFQKEELDALKSGEVDAIYTYGGRASHIESLGLARKIFDIAEHGSELEINNLYPDVITVGAEFAEKNPDLVKTYMSCVLKASSWAENNRDEVLRIFAKGSFVPVQAFESSVAYDFNKHLTPDLSEASIAALESQKDFLLEIGFIENDFDVRSWINPRFLEEAFREALDK